MSFAELLEQASTERVREHRDVPVVVRGEKVTIRVHELPSYDWAELTSKHPPRKVTEFNIDRIGYNVTAASIEGAGLGAYVVEGEEETKITPEQWETLCSVLSGAEVSHLADVAFMLNDWTPRMRLVEAKKGSAGGSKKKSSSPANLESPSAD